MIPAVHRPWWKVAINTPLRALQGRRPWLVASVFDVETGRLLGYTFAQIALTGAARPR